MPQPKFDDSTAGILTKEKNLVLACEIYNECRAIPKDSRTPGDPVSKLLGEPGNLELVGTICKEFPHALIWLAKMVLLKAVLGKCKERLNPLQKWKIYIESMDDKSLLAEPWPGISLEPVISADKSWSFYFSMDATRVPISCEHGIVYSEKGGQPLSMSKGLQAAVSEVENEFVKLGFNVKKSPNHGWFAKTYKPYKRLGDDPPVLQGIFDGTLADEIACEFVQLFADWSQKIERLNSLLNVRRST